MKRAIIILCLCLSIGVFYAYGQSSSIPSAMFIIDDATHLERKVGLPFTVILEVTLPQSSSVTQIPIPTEWEWLTVQMITPLETFFVDGVKKEQWQLSVISWQLGELSTPRATLMIQNEIGNFEEITVSPAFFQVMGVWDGGESLKQPVSLAKISLQIYWRMLGVGMVFILILLIVWRTSHFHFDGSRSMFRLRSKPSSEFLRRLRNITATALTIEEQARLVDEALRHYIRRRFNLKTKLSHLTHSEFQRLLQDELQLNANTELQTLYNMLSTIKYSPVGIVITDSSTLPNLAKAWLQGVDADEGVK